MLRRFRVQELKSKEALLENLNKDEVARTGKMYFFFCGKGLGVKI